MRNRVGFKKHSTVALTLLSVVWLFVLGINIVINWATYLLPPDKFSFTEKVN